MSSLKLSIQTLLARQDATCLAVQALIEHLLVNGSITPLNLVEFREFGLHLADQLQEYGTPEDKAKGIRLESEVRVWWNVLGVPEGMSRLVDKTDHV